MVFFGGFFWVGFLLPTLVQMPRGPLSALHLPGHGGLRHPRDDLQLHYEVRCGHQEGPVRQYFAVRWHDNVPRYCRQDGERDHSAGPLNLANHQDLCPAGEKAFRLERGFDPFLTLYLPADVDLQAGVRRVRSLNCPQEVLLSAQDLWVSLPVIKNGNSKIKDCTCHLIEHSIF